MLDAFTPRTLEELYENLKEMTSKSRIIAGGTDLGIHINHKTVDADKYMYLGYLKETREVVEKEDFVEIGAYVTHTELEYNPIINKYFTAIADAGKDVGSLQIRNNGTIGGNVGNASPAADLLPVLFMLDAYIVIATKDGELKEVKVSDFLLGPGKTTLGVGEAILKIKVYKKQNLKSAFVKLGSRKKLTISRIGLTLGLVVENDIVKEAKVFIGAISLKPVNFVKAEEILLNKNVKEIFTSEVKKEISQKMSDLIFEVTPEKFDRDYKMWASKAVVFDTFDRLEKRI